MIFEMKKLFILFLVIVVCIASCTNSSINEELKQIENLLQQNQTDQAYKFLSEINTDNIDEGIGHITTFCLLKHSTKNISHSQVTRQLIVL